MHTLLIAVEDVKVLLINEVSFITDTESERIEDLSCQLNFCEIIFRVTRLNGYGPRNGNFVQPPRLQAIS